MNKISVSTIKENRAKIDKVHESEKQAEKVKNDSIWNIRYKVYEPKIRALENERDNEIKTIEQTTKTAIDGMTQTIRKLYQPIDQAKRIIKFLRLNLNKDLSINDDNFIVRESYNNPKYKELLGYLYNDEFLTIKVFIISNKKPSNKYSLVVIGKCLFYDEFDNPILRVPHNYIDNAYYSTNDRIDVEHTIKDLPSVKELKDWYVKNYSKVLAEFLAEYQQVKAEYAEVKQTYTKDDFKDIFTFICPECGNFYTTLDDLSHGYIPECRNHNTSVKMIEVKR